MIYKVTRSSIRNPMHQPCRDAARTEINERLEFERLPNETDNEFERRAISYDSRINFDTQWHEKDGKLSCYVKTHAWVVDIQSIDALLNMMEEEGQLLIKPAKYPSIHREIEIFDINIESPETKSAVRIMEGAINRL